MIGNPPDRAPALSTPSSVRYKRGPVIRQPTEIYDPNSSLWTWLPLRTRIDHCDPHRGRLLEHVRR